MEGICIELPALGVSRNLPIILLRLYKNRDPQGFSSPPRNRTLQILSELGGVQGEGGGEISLVQKLSLSLLAPTSHVRRGNLRRPLPGMPRIAPEPTAHVKPESPGQAKRSSSNEAAGETWLSEERTGGCRWAPAFWRPRRPRLPGSLRRGVD